MEIAKNFTCPFPSFDFATITNKMGCLNLIHISTQFPSVFQGNLTHWNRDLRMSCGLNPPYALTMTEWCKGNISQAVQDLCLNNQFKDAQDIAKKCSKIIYPIDIPYRQIIVISCAFITFIALAAIGASMIHQRHKRIDEGRQKLLVTSEINHVF